MMSEKAPKIEVPKASPEHHHKGHEAHKSHEKQSSHKENAHEQQEKLSAIRSEVAQEAHETSDVAVDTSRHNQQPGTHAMVDKELKGVMLTRTLTRIQKQLSPAQRSLSKVVHNKAVDKVSAVSEKTIARPIGFLGGSFLALLGSLFSTYMAKQFGLHYNLLVFALLFVLGYCIASILELLYRIIRRPKRT